MIDDIEIAEEWEAFRSDNNPADELVAIASFAGKTKQSNKLNIKPSPQVLVNFRPHAGWKGEFGFDWIRMGDTGLKGDDWYKNIIGKYKQRQFLQQNSEYIRLGRKFRKLQHPIKPKDTYVVPVLAIYPNKEATLTLKVEIEGSDAKEIIYKYDNNYLELNKTEVSHKTVGKKELANDLTIKCIQEFGADQFIEVEADGKFAGKLKVIANDKNNRYQANIAIVKVKTLISPKNLKKGFPIGREAVLKKYLNQALVEPLFETLELDLSTDTTFNNNFLSNGFMDRSKAKGNAIQDYLNNKLYSKYGKAKYERCYKIYFIDETDSRQKLYGRSYGIPSTPRSIVVYQKGFTDSTVAHEILHAMGLNHSFDNKGDFTFQRYKTDNIMDYSDIAPNNPMPVISTWQWQWDIIHKNTDKEK